MFTLHDVSLPAGPHYLRLSSGRRQRSALTSYLSRSLRLSRNCTSLPPGVVLNMVPPGVVEYSWGMWAASWMATRFMAGISRLRLAWLPADISLIAADQLTGGKLFVASLPARTTPQINRWQVTLCRHVVRATPKQPSDFLPNNTRRGGLWLAETRGRHDTSNCSFIFSSRGNASGNNKQLSLWNYWTYKIKHKPKQISKSNNNISYIKTITKIPFYRNNTQQLCHIFVY